MVGDLGSMTCEKRLEELDLFSLEERRLQRHVWSFPGSLRRLLKGRARLITVVCVGRTKETWNEVFRLEIGRRFLGLGFFCNKDN